VAPATVEYEISVKNTGETTLKLEKATDANCPALWGPAKPELGGDECANDPLMPPYERRAGFVRDAVTMGDVATEKDAFPRDQHAIEDRHARHLAEWVGVSGSAGNTSQRQSGRVAVDPEGEGEARGRRVIRQVGRRQDHQLLREWPQRRRRACAADDKSVVNSFDKLKGALHGCIQRSADGLCRAPVAMARAPVVVQQVGAEARITGRQERCGRRHGGQAGVGSVRRDGEQAAVVLGEDAKHRAARYDFTCATRLNVGQAGAVAVDGTRAYLACGYDGGRVVSTPITITLVP
jgi:hypothetical protein